MLKIEPPYTNFSLPKSVKHTVSYHVVIFVTSLLGCHRLLRNLVRTLQDDCTLHRGVVQDSRKRRFPQGKLMTSRVFSKFA